MKVCPRCSELYPDDAVRCPRDGAEVRAVLDPLIGKTVGGRYRLISRLGSGGMSSVYLARHVMIDRLMAIKTLRRDLAQDPVQRDRFLREARAVNRINHENIVEITDFGESDDGMVYLVMEYVPGEQLLKTMSAGPFPALRALDIAEQIGNALARAHQMGIVHRDLKPENIVLVQRKNRPDFVKVLDFGIAKIMDAPSLTGSQQIFGTPGYIAPEYIQSTEIDGRADLYSLGVLLYEMVTGALPFDYEYPGDLLVKHVTEQPIPPSQRLPSLQPAVEALVLQCLRKRPEDRFRDAYHFVSELQKVRERIGADSSWTGLSERKKTEPPPKVIAGIAADLPPPTDVAVPASETPLEVDIEVGAPTPVLPDAQRAALLQKAAPPETSRTRKRAPNERERPTTRDYVRPVIPEPPAIDGIDIPIDVEVQSAAAAQEDGRPTPKSLAADGLLGVRRWRKRFEALRASLDDVEIEEGAPPEVTRAMALAVRTLESIEEGVLEAESLQERVEQTSLEARELRARSGERIDVLARQLSTKRGELDRLAQLRNDLRARREVAMVKARMGDGEGHSDALLWELAQCEEELRVVGASSDELEAELGALGRDLDRHNERAEAALGQLVARLDQLMLHLEPLAVALRAPLEHVEEFLIARYETKTANG